MGLIGWMGWMVDFFWLMCERREGAYIEVRDRTERSRLVKDKMRYLEFFLVAVRFEGYCEGAYSKVSD
jgi:hypothetical protein